MTNNTLAFLMIVAGLAGLFNHVEYAGWVLFFGIWIAL